VIAVRALIPKPQRGASGLGSTACASDSNFWTENFSSIHNPNVVQLSTLLFLYVSQAIPCVPLGKNAQEVGSLPLPCGGLLSVTLRRDRYLTIPY